MTDLIILNMIISLDVIEFERKILRRIYGTVFNSTTAHLEKQN
jgi:hypothetical protein